EALLNQYITMVKTNLPETGGANDAHLDSQVHEASAAWAGLAAAVEQFNASLKVAHAHPLQGPTMRALSTALDTLYLSWSRLRDLPADLAGPTLPDMLSSQWEQVAAQVEAARIEFNCRVGNYNEAIDQFPARVLAWVFGFKSAQPI
ncbi:MAG: LemA family protein, partial [Rhodoferax sp.]